MNEFIFTNTPTNKVLHFLGFKVIGTDYKRHIFDEDGDYIGKMSAHDVSAYLRTNYITEVAQ